MLHLVFNRASDELKAFALDGSLAWSAPCRNNTVEPGFGHWGACPPGEYVLERPQALAPPEVPFGAWFIALDDPHGIWFAHDDRAGIGIHGGGSGLPDPFAPQQGWQITEGCFRLQNADLAALVGILEGGERFTVT